MAAITTAIAGNWSSTSTWSGGVVPGNGDTVIITKAVTVDVNTTVGASNGQYATSPANPAAIQLNSGGTLTIAAGVKLTVRGDFTVNTGYNVNVTGLTLQAGAIFEFDSSATTASPSNYRFMPLGTSNEPGHSIKANGTQASPCYIQSNAGGANGAGYANGYSGVGGLNCSWTYFIRLGDSSHNAWEVGINSLMNIALNNCTFDTCSTLHCTVQATTSTAQPSFTNVIWKNSTASSYNTDVEAYTLFTNCSFDVTFKGDGLTGASFNNCYTQLRPGTTGSAQKWSQFNNIFVRCDQQPGWIAQGDMNNVVLFDDFSTANPKFSIHNANMSHNHTGVICEYTNQDDQGDCFHYAGATNQSYAVKNCLVLPGASGSCSGDQLTLSGTFSNAFVSQKNNTFIVGDQGATYNETVSVPSGTITKFANNIAWDTSARHCMINDVGHLSSSTGITQDVVSPQNGDYNCRFNVKNNDFDLYPACSSYYTNSGNGYFGQFSSTPGQHDKVIDPMFVDKTRNTALFDSEYLGNTYPAWSALAAGHSFAVGDIVQVQNTTLTLNGVAVGYYGGALINMRCIQAHTKGTANSDPFQSWTTSWRSYWEFATLYRLRTSIAQGAAGLPLTITDPTLGLVNADYVATLIAWIKAGFAPQNTSLRMAGFDGTDIGAVPVVGANQTAGMTGFF